MVLLLLAEPPLEHAASARAVKETTPAASKFLIFIHNPAFSKIKNNLNLMFEMIIRQRLKKFNILILIY